MPWRRDQYWPGVGAQPIEAVGFTRLLLRGQLEQLGYEVVADTGAAEALDAAIGLVMLTSYVDAYAAALLPAQEILHAPLTVDSQRRNERRKRTSIKCGSFTPSCVSEIC